MSRTDRSVAQAIPSGPPAACGRAARSGDTIAADVVRQLFEFASGSSCPVVITSRDSLWASLSTDDMRARTQVLELLPFKKHQISKYRKKAFLPSNSAAAGRFDLLMDELGRMSHRAQAPRLRDAEIECRRLS